MLLTVSLRASKSIFFTSDILVGVTETFFDGLLLSLLRLCFIIDKSCTVLSNDVTLVERVDIVENISDILDFSFDTEEIHSDSCNK